MISASVAVFGSVTETFARRNLNRTVDESLEMFAPVVAQAREALRQARAELTAHGRANVPDYIIFLTDGEANIGSVYGAKLSRFHDVTLIGGAAHVEAIRRDGLVMQGAVTGTLLARGLAMQPLQFLVAVRPRRLRWNKYRTKCRSPKNFIRRSGARRDGGRRGDRRDRQLSRQ